MPEHAYDGLVASLMAWHGAATALAYARRDSDADEDIRYVTASLTVRRPTPIGVELEITGRPKAHDRRKSWIDLALSANGTECATATMLAIRLRPENRGS